MTNQRNEKMNLVAAARQQAAVVLEDIHDPHNAAAVLRSCEAFGIPEVFLIFKEEKKFNPAKIGPASSASANSWLQFHTFSSHEECFATLRQRGFSTVATVLDSAVESLFSANFSEQKIAWLFGNEHRGLSPEIVAAADRKIHIPMSGFVQSLNLSVTAGICLFETTRQRRNGEWQNFLLPEGEQRELIAEWTK